MAYAETVPDWFPLNLKVIQDFADIFDSGSGSGSGSGSEGDDEASGTNLRRSSISPNPSATESKNQNKVQPIISPEDEENQEDSGSGSESGSGSGEGTEEKRSKIVEEIVTDMARAALEAGHSDTGIKKSDLPTGSLNNEFIEASVVKKSLIEVPRSVDDADEDSLKFTVKRDNNSVASSQNKDETDPPLKQLVKNILREDLNKMAEVSSEKLKSIKDEDEAKLIQDLSEVVGVEKIADEKEKGEYKSKISTEIKDLEGLANSLANMEQLDKEHHDNIAAKLEQDLLKHFKISKDDENTIKTEADSLLRDSEKYYVKESIPSLKKDEIENLSKSVGKSAWAKMIKGTQQKKETADKVKRDFEELRKLQ